MHGDLFRCSVSIAGVSDLKLLETQAGYFVGGAIAREQIGTDSSKHKADSPRNHAADVSIPLLMIHGANQTVRLCSLPSRSFSRPISSAARLARSKRPAHSHSIVAGGLPEMS